MIRQADVTDFKNIKKMFVNFANSAPVTYLHNPKYDPDHIDQVLYSIMKQGILLYAEQDDKPAGFFMAVPAPDLWLPHIKPVMREAAWWVQPEHRDGTIGGKLFLKYEQLAKAMKARGHIQGYTMTLMEQSPKIKLDKYGFKPIETVYYAE
tara:strand:+ start:2331 stop:2783 length:453 start_codon:yes stop_codon:yes gene_type:complete